MLNLLGEPSGLPMPFFDGDLDETEAWAYSMTLRAFVVGWENRGLQRELAAFTDTERRFLAARHSSFESLRTSA